MSNLPSRGGGFISDVVAPAFTVVGTGIAGALVVVSGVALMTVFFLSINLFGATVIFPVVYLAMWAACLIHPFAFTWQMAFAVSFILAVMKTIFVNTAKVELKE